MVYRGRSKGCLNCRERRVRCDLGRPSCHNCVKRRTPCPGVAKDPGIQFEDETSAVVEQMQRRQAKRMQQDRCSQQALVSVSVAPKYDIQKAAVCFFFRNYVSPGTSSELSRGFLSNIVEMYGSVPAESPVYLATSALSVTFLGAWYGQGFETPLARRYLGQTYTALSKSLNDPLECLSDETLVAVLLLRFLDNLSWRTARRHRPPPEHLDGAFALIKHRREANLETERSRRMLRSVVHSRILSALEGEEFIEPDSEPWQDPDATSIDADAFPNFDPIAVETVNLQASFALWKASLLRQELSKQIHSKASGNAIVFRNFLRTASELDSRLKDWAATQPSQFRPLTVSGLACIPKSVADVGVFGESCEIYSSFVTSDLWNTYRRFRLVVLIIILDCEKALWDPFSTLSFGDVPNVQEVGRTMREMFDGVCACIPFHLGNRTQTGTIDEFMNLNKVEFPMPPEEASTKSSRAFPSFTARSYCLLPKEERTRLSVALSGWSLIEPLTHLIKLLSGEYGGLIETFLQDGQKEWIHGQFRRMIKLQSVGSIPPVAMASNDDSLASKIDVKEAFFNIGNQPCMT